MSANGYLVIYTFAGKARLPLKDTAILVTGASGEKLFSGKTDLSGKLGPITLAVPDKNQSQTPQSTQIPYTAVTVTAIQDRFEAIEAQNIQLFAGVTTLQAFEMIPLAEAPDNRGKTEYFITPPQQL